MTAREPRAPAVDEATARLLERARETLGAGGAPLLLDAITWPRSVERAFFASGAEKLPEPRYHTDRDAVLAKLARLDAFERELAGDDAIVRLLRSTVESHRHGCRMILAVGTAEFYAVAREAYGGARSGFIDSDTTNLDLARHLAVRIGSPREEEDDGARLDAGQMVAFLEERLAKRRHAPDVTFEITEDISAKVIAGKKRVRIRADATFAPEEARSLYLHEVETHVFTAQNGAAQPTLPFLQSGGPRSTRTQEGLAVFAEFYAQALTLPRLKRLVDRVELVALAEEGASFLDLYRYLLDLGRTERAAYLDAARVCRGGLTTGGAPFPKDASYLSGFVEVYDFLRLAVTHDRADIPEVLVSGRFGLEDVEALLELRRTGVLEPPAFAPSWVRRYSDLLTHFAFTSFLTEIDLRVVAKRYAWL